MRFTRHNKTALPNKLSDNFIPCHAGEKILINDRLEQALHIQQLISATPSVYKTVYSATLNNVAAWCQAMPWDVSSTQGSLLQHQLTLCIETLKIRRGLLLPKNTGAEAIAENEARWTYALFSASLLYQLHRVLDDRQLILYDSKGERLGNYSLLVGSPHTLGHYYTLEWQSPSSLFSVASMMGNLIAQLVPTTVMYWLSQNTELFALWWNTVTQAQQTDTTLSDILQRAATNAGYPLVIAASSVKPLQPITEHITEQFVETTHSLFFGESDVVNAASHNVLPLLLAYFSENQQTLNWLRVNEGLLLPKEIITSYVDSLDLFENLESFLAALKDYLVVENDEYFLTYRPKAFEDGRRLQGIVIREDKLTPEWQSQPMDTEFYLFN